MGFYNANTPEQKRVKKLTGDINISDLFKNECKTRGIAIYNAYNIQKRLLHEVEQEQLHGVKEVDDRLMELLDERGKNKVTHRYVDFISNEDSASKGIIPQKTNEQNPLPPNQIRIPPRARDGKQFLNDDELPEIEMLKKIMLQNKKIINQNKIILEQLRKLGEKDD
ncbi:MULTISPECIES: hypothetical protein [Methanobrevibacter]|uniref:Uncharacterized protein n=1 Tax=Methanobrevibacter gottschalkii DSM 11977 TaxID=1122229 RepID=A0A3N5B617_9EURY|nr:MULTISPECIES: hypothetical protein [Methanobrevibacter]OEC96395.1 hypothetical protein A9505_06930 [Methanobrevibacter sp. A27]RPF52783.1 hypothetical protein EDC42_0341 [Methanobrevibacter gottschalkii DSM 11977]